MKRIILLLFIGLTVMACTNTPQQIDTETQMVMHKLIERSHPDSVKKYLNYYAAKYELPTDFSEIADGHYRGASPYDDYGYKHQVEFEVSDGKLLDINYDEVHKDGHSKKSDTTYNAQMNENAYGSAPVVTYDEYEQRLLDAQRFGEVDAIAGATYSLYRLEYAVWRAVLNGPQKKN